MASCYSPALTLGLFFLRSAWGKLADVRGFRHGLADYHLLPAWAVAPLAWALPLLEAVLAAALLVGVALPVAAAGAAGLLLTFSVAIVINLRRGRAIACNCHGSAQPTPISWGLVVRNALLLVLALLLVGAAPHTVSLASLAARWQAEWALVASWNSVPLAVLGSTGGLAAAILTTTLDLHTAVQQAVHPERNVL